MVNIFYCEVYLVEIPTQPSLLGAGKAYSDLIIASLFLFMQWISSMNNFYIMRNVDTPSSFNLSLRSGKIN